MTRNLARAVLTTGLAVSASLTMALPAQAHGTRQVTCNGALGATTVGDVVVANGTACVLTGTKVKGGITVGAGAAVDLSGVTVYKNVTATGSGRVTAVESFVYGDVTTTGSGIVRLTDSAVRGDVSVQGDTTAFTAAGLGVGGDLSGSTVNRFDVSASYVRGSLTANEAFSGANLCANRVTGDAVVTGGGGALLLGGTATCAGNQVRGDVVVDDNFAYIAIAGNTVRGDLICDGNDPAPEVGANKVRGTRSGQCA